MMKLRARFRAWWDARKPLSLNKCLAVEFDADIVCVHVLQRISASWEQAFRWDEIVRVCFKDGGIYSSDILFIELRGREKPAVVPTEARGGSEFFADLCGRGLFPLDVMRSAIRETGGKTHCWPQK